MKKRSVFTFVAYLLLIVLVAGLLFYLAGPMDEKLPYSEVVTLFRQEQVETFKLDGDTITLWLNKEHDGKDKIRTSLSDPEYFMDQMGELIDQQHAAGILKEYNLIPQKGMSAYDFILPLCVVGLILLVIGGIIMGKANANNHQINNFGKARTVNGKNAKNKVTFQDVAGVDEEKEELQEVVDFLRNPKKFTDMGAKIPHGILLAGPPGTGKTLLAKAVAGEASVQFLSISGSDFMEMYVGVGASRVRDLFDQAKKVAPAIIFIDEIDAVGRKRGSGLGGGHDEREQTLNQLLVEMDGFDRTEGVIVLAATNRPDILDPALLRPGRFDRQIRVGLPDSRGREQILKVHAKNKRLGDDVDLKVVAMATSGFSGADLSNLLNEAAILAARDDRPVLKMDDMNEAMMKILAGPEKRSRLRLKKDQRLTAFHEAGHAVAMYRLPHHDPVHQISIIPRGNALGLTWTTPKEDSDHLTRNEMYERIIGLLGGRVAEALFLNDISTGASNDIERATKLARDMIGRYGMSESLGTVSYLGGDELFIGRDYQSTKSYSEKFAGTMDDEVKALIGKAYQQCEQILREDADKLQAVVEFLLEHETMTGKQFADCMEGKEIGEAGNATLFDSFQQNDSE